MERVTLDCDKQKHCTVAKLALMMHDHPRQEIHKSPMHIECIISDNKIIHDHN